MIVDFLDRRAALQQQESQAKSELVASQTQASCDKISPAARSTKKFKGRNLQFVASSAAPIPSSWETHLVVSTVFKMSSMVTATTWVPRGFAAPFPTKYNFDEEEFERIANLAKLQLDDAKEDLEEAEAQENGEETEKVSKKEKKAKSAEKDDDASEYAPLPQPATEEPR